MKSEAYRLVEIINRYDVEHRKGWKPSDYIGEPPSGEHIRSEHDELQEALADHAKADWLDTLDPSLYSADQLHDCREDVKDEMGDVLACLYQTAYRMGVSAEELDAIACKKMRLRFPKLIEVEESIPHHKFTWKMTVHSSVQKPARRPTPEDMQVIEHR